MLRDAGKIDVQHVRAVDVELQFANQRLFVDDTLQLDHSAAVAHHGRHLVGPDNQADIRLAVTIEYGRHPAIAAQTTGLTLAA